MKKSWLFGLWLLTCLLWANQSFAHISAARGQNNNDCKCVALQNPGWGFPNNTQNIELVTVNKDGSCRYKECIYGSNNCTAHKVKPNERWEFNGENFLGPFFPLDPFNTGNESVDGKWSYFTTICVW